jgi:Mn-dependent DtxR family transcriptional regulator
MTDGYTNRLYTYEDVRLVSMFARLEGAPQTVEEILRDLDAKGRLSKEETGRAAA